MTPISSPHVHGGDAVAATMLSVMLALLPAVLVAVYLYGWLAVQLIVLCVGTCMLTEALCLRAMGRPSTVLQDGSAALTGLLLAMVLPPYVPWWIPLLGSMTAIALGKQVYGGLGFNPFNPALAARVVLLISFPLFMTTWIVPMSAVRPPLDLYALGESLRLMFAGPASLGLELDAISQASPLGYVKTEWSRGVGFFEAMRHYDYSYANAFLGFEAGSLGESSALALLLGGVYLLARHTITWHIPTAYLATVAALAFVFHAIDPQHYPPALFHLLAGGLMLCAFFMATDPVTSPVTPMGQIVFGIGCGVITWGIRSFGGYPEGAMFAVLLMNCTVPLIDHYCRPRVYGTGLRS